MSTQETKEFNKLTQLCNNVNERYASGRNDDDQVRSLFDYSNKITSAFIAIGFSTYEAINTAQLEDFKKLPHTPSACGKYISFENNRIVRIKI